MKEASTLRYIGQRGGRESHYTNSRPVFLARRSSERQQRRAQATCETAALAWHVCMAVLCAVDFAVERLGLCAAPAHIKSL